VRSLDFARDSDIGREPNRRRQSKKNSNRIEDEEIRAQLSEGVDKIIKQRIAK
jgi:hypothetical protein